MPEPSGPVLPSVRRFRVGLFLAATYFLCIVGATIYAYSDNSGLTAIPVWALGLPSSITMDNMIQSWGAMAGSDAIFARELAQLIAAGYQPRGRYLMPPPK